LRQSRHRRPLPAHLPREIHRLDPAETSCPECGSGVPQRSQRGAAGTGLQRPESDPHGQGEKGLHPM
jgi:hypothetical protein